MKRKNFIVLLLAIVLSVFSSCDNSNDEVVSTTWKGYTKSTEIILSLNDDNTCTLTVSSIRQDVPIHHEVFLYEGWYGVNQLSFYRGKDYINAESFYIGKFENLNKLVLVQLVNGEEFFLVDLYRVFE